MSKRPRKDTAGAGSIDDDRVDFIHVGTEFSSTAGRQHQGQHRTWDGKPRDYSRDAFKGGFIAGYHGTVGSKEGWQPTASFVSSRNKRVERTQMRPEDFMDEEDLADIQATKRITVAGEYRTDGERPPESAAVPKESNARDGIVGVIADAFAAEFNAIRVSDLSSRIGDSIMASMGWKPGQGLGPLTRAIDRYFDDASKRLPPRPTPLRSLRSKTDMRGVGYGIDASDLPADTSSAEQSSHAPALPALGTLFKKRDKKLSGGASTVQDIGKAKKMRQQQARSDKLRLSFGVDGDGDDDDDVGITAAVGMVRKPMSALDMLVRGAPKATRNVPLLKGIEQGLDFCHDGRQPLSGFVLICPSESEFRHYDGPVVPESYTGIRSSSSRSRWDSMPVVGSQSKLGHGTGALVTANDRAKLGVVDAPRPAAQQPIQQQQLISSETARAALAGFTPYEADPAKQARYLEYLTACADSSKDGIQSCATSALAEAPEFARMAQVFKPNSVMMSRFTSATATSADPLASIPETCLASQASSKKQVARRVNATRTTLEWIPARLLCKRMNVQPPAHSLAREQGEQRQKDSGAMARRARAADFILWESSNSSIAPTVLASDALSATPIQKPDLSLFQSIFGDDDDDE
ncbi:hypothetical protein IWW47_002317 [Coemansia sp. RSA 2052]|nr:hypothetical protein IWW47_002317 [Coemansia sp. RSA 2052]